MLSKVVIPVAGLGTRVLPASKAIPKEMLTVLLLMSQQFQCALVFWRQQDQ